MVDTFFDNFLLHSNLFIRIATFSLFILFGVWYFFIHPSELKRKEEKEKFFQDSFRKFQQELTLNQAEVKQLLVKEFDINRIIQDLSVVERFSLVFVIREPNTLDQKESIKMIMAYKNYFKNINLLLNYGLNPFEEVLNSLVKKKLIEWNNEDTRAFLTSLGYDVIKKLRKDKAYPFDFDSKFLKIQYQQDMSLK